MKTTFLVCLAVAVLVASCDAASPAPTLERIKRTVRAGDGYNGGSNDRYNGGSNGGYNGGSNGGYNSGYSGGSRPSGRSSRFGF